MLSFISRDDTDPININDIDFNKLKTSVKKLHRKNDTHLDIIYDIMIIMKSYP